MNYNIIIRPEAENDLKEAFLWYETNREGLGYDFLLHFNAGVNFLERNANIFKTEYKGIRKYLIKRFPYKIIYLMKNEIVIIVAVIHVKRNPGLLRKRLIRIER